MIATCGLRFGFSRTVYDMVAIGPHAAKVARLVSKRFPNELMSKLAIVGEERLFQSQLINHPAATIELDTQFRGEEKLKVVATRPVVEIVPKECKVVLAGGEEIHYRQLVCSPLEQECKDVEVFSGLVEKLETPHSFVGADYRLNSTGELYKRLNGNIYFTVPKGRHFASQNLFMAHLADKLKQELPVKSRKELPYKIKVVYEDSLVAFHPEIDAIIKEVLHNKGIELIQSKITNIDYETMSITLQNGIKDTFSSIFHYLPSKNSPLLSKSGIDHLKINRHSLNHCEYDNIFIIGNNLQTPHSFYTLNYINHVVAQNVIQRYLKTPLGQYYNGEGFLPFWDGGDSLRYFSFDYDGVGKYNDIGRHPTVGRLLGLDKKHLCNWELDTYFNGSSYGVPYYFFSPKLKDVILQKTTVKK